jgi:hypothetical protein
VEPESASLHTNYGITLAQVKGTACLLLLLLLLWVNDRRID